MSEIEKIDKSITELISSPYNYSPCLLEGQYKKVFLEYHQESLYNKICVANNLQSVEAIGCSIKSTLLYESKNKLPNINFRLKDVQVINLLIGIYKPKELKIAINTQRTLVYNDSVKAIGDGNFIKAEEVLNEALRINLCEPAIYTSKFKIFSNTRLIGHFTFCVLFFSYTLLL